MSPPLPTLVAESNPNLYHQVFDEQTSGAGLLGTDPRAAIGQLGILEQVR